MRPRALNNRINAGFALALVIFLLLSSSLVFFSLLWLQASKSESRAAEISRQLERVLLLTIDVETGQHGFILTGREEYLEPYYRAIATIDESQNRLRQAVDDPQQQLWLQQLEPLINRRISLAKQAVQLRQEQGFIAAQEQILSNQGKQVQDQIRDMVAQLQYRETKLLNARSREAQQVAKITIVGAIAGLVAAPLLVFYQLRLVRQKVRQVSQAESNLRQANEQLESANQELEGFTYAASHDLKTPLRGISGLIAILKRKISSKITNEEHSLLEQIIKDCEYAMRLVDDILIYSRVGRLQEQPKLVNVNQLLTEVVAHLNPEIIKTQASIRWDRIPNVWADPFQLIQVFENLIANALKYRSKEHPLIISITAEATPQEWIFSVRDNGIGIAPEDQGQLFTMFKRLHSQSEYEGTGIGLATVKKIAMRHGGTAWVESEGAGCGSTFRFSIRR
ncbi:MULTISPECIES: CHASE3 domain-containing protein [Trichocoleus]|uniref:histidine kinase n=1 Tax=Trichocoleus desertorum GB2-A4 TaxID=2933944 RepID=A0ABV0JF06_9CYAN|nr:sensor histidine kinase [Trichocoleus sp. FACHB-46]MBD1864279.1 CHASE3 domain-containing protein [Trichocoleus sp. FACHB-46]